MWWKKKEQKKEEIKEENKEQGLLEELCGDDVKLYGFLCNHLLTNPLTASSAKDVDILIEEAEKSGDFTPAMDKAIFEATQNPEERERYIKVIQNIALNTLHATEQEKEEADKQGFTEHVTFLERRIEDQKFINERTEEIINVASKYYNEKLLGLREDERRAARGEERERIEFDEWKLRAQEKDEREARREERKKMGKEERREAEIQEKKLEIETEERKEARAEESREAEREESRIEARENVERLARKEERRREKQR